MDYSSIRFGTRLSELNEVFNIPSYKSHSFTCLVLLSKLECQSSVTRFGKIWLIFEDSGNLSKSLFSIWQKFEPTLAKLYAFV